MRQLLVDTMRGFFSSQILSVVARLEYVNFNFSKSSPINFELPAGFSLAHTAQVIYINKWYCLKMNFVSVYLTLTILCCISSTLALECYVCKNQERNHEKCLNTIQTCEQEEDMCLSEIKWGSPPYWSRGNAKQYYVSKKCASRNECDRVISKSMPSCSYIWYYDWKCAECCAGDRCNYYVTLAGHSIRSSVLVSGLCVIVATVIRNLWL